MSSASEEALRAEIARLTGAINRHKSTGPTTPASFAGRNNAYVNPSYKPPKPPSTRAVAAPRLPVPPTSAPAASASRPLNVSEPREVLIDGVAFQSSGRSLVRKDLAPAFQPPRPPVKPARPPRTNYSRNFPGARTTQRPYKPRSARGRPQNHNMSLVNGRKPVRLGRKSVKSIKYSDKQCSRFSTTGLCSRGLTCPYQHDPSKIAVCWPFLQGSCPNTAETCSLSHDPTPERAPLCVHFANNGRCKNGESCLFPHIHVGPRSGVCRDFAVLGYCEKGIDCDKQHVRECPDFAESGTCPNPKCKLPHVIRANRNRAKAAATAAAHEAKNTASSDKASGTKQSTSGSVQTTSADDSLVSQRTQQGVDGNIGDEYISLTFHESGESDEDSESESGEDGESEEENGDSDADGEVDAGPEEVEGADYT